MCRKIEPIISCDSFFPIRPTPRGLIGFANLTYGGQLALNGIAVYTRPSGEGFRLVYPIKVLPNGKEVNYFCPLNREIGEVLTNSVIVKINMLVTKINHCK